MSWTPINPAHAIERVRFIVKFRENVPHASFRGRWGRTIARKRHDIRLEGPIPLNNFNFALKLTDEGQPIVTSPPTSAPGWQFSRSSSAGEPIELAAVTGDQVIYETIEYRKWETFKQRFDKIMTDLIEMAVLTLDVDLISLEYFDRFFYDGPVEDAAPATLLVGLADQLHQDAFVWSNSVAHPSRMV